MVREFAEPHAMGGMAVVEAGIAGFGGVEVAVEALDFDADFGDEAAGEVGGEGGWVVGCGVGEETGGGLAAGL